MDEPLITQAAGDTFSGTQIRVALAGHELTANMPERINVKVIRPDVTLLTQTLIILREISVETRKRMSLAEITIVLGKHLPQGYSQIGVCRAVLPKRRQSATSVSSFSGVMGEPPRSKGLMPRGWF